MFIKNEIISDCDRYHLSCLVDSEFNKQKFSAITLGFYVNGKVNDIWDNESFLIETLYPYLKGLQIELSSSDIHEINCLIDEDVKEELIEMFDTAINLGWFNNVNNITENSDNPSDSRIRLTETKTFGIEVDIQDDINDDIVFGEKVIHIKQDILKTLIFKHKQDVIDSYKNDVLYEYLTDINLNDIFNEFEFESLYISIELYC